MCHEQRSYKLSNNSLSAAIYNLNLTSKDGNVIRFCTNFSGSVR